MISVLAICKRSAFILRIQSHLLSHGIEIISICNNSLHGAESYKKNKPDIVIIDANWSYPLYAVSGSKLIQQIKAVNPDCKIIITTNTEERDTIERLRQFDVNGYFYRNMTNTLNSIVECIKKVYDGEYCFS